MTNGKKMVSNVFYYFLDFATMTFFGYLFWIIMGRMLEPTQYGILWTSLSLFQILSIVLTFGFYESLPKFISEFKIKKQMKKVKSLIFFSSNIVFYFSFILAVLGLLYSENISMLIYGSDMMANAFRILSVLLFGGSVAWLLKSIAQGLQNFKKIFIADFIGCCVKIFLSVVLVLLGFQALSGILAYMGWYVIIMLVLFFTVSKFSSRERSIDKGKILKFSFYSLLSSFALMFLMQGNIFLLSFLSSFEASALFGVGFLFAQIIQFIPNVLMGALFPNISEMWEKKRNVVREIVSLSIKIITVTVLPLLILFVIFSKFLISFLYSQVYIEASSLFPPLLLGTFALGITNILMITLYSAHKPKKRLSILVLGAVVNLVLSLAFIPELGALGAVISFFISSIIMLMFSLLSLNKILKLYFSKKTILLIPLLFVFGMVLLFTQSLENYYLKTFVVLADTVLYLVALLKLGIVNENDMKVLNYIPDSFGLKKIKKIIRKLV